MKTYRMKPLKWECEHRHSHTATTVFGPLRVVPDNGSWRYEFTELNARMFASSLDEAKQRAEAWYLSRLLPALEEV